MIGPPRRASLMEEKGQATDSAPLVVQHKECDTKREWFCAARIVYAIRIRKDATVSIHPGIARDPAY